MRLKKFIFNKITGYRINRKWRPSQVISNYFYKKNILSKEEFYFKGEHHRFEFNSRGYNPRGFNLFYFYYILVFIQERAHVCLCSLHDHKDYEIFQYDPTEPCRSGTDSSCTGR